MTGKSMDTEEFTIQAPYEGCEVGDRLTLEVTGMDDSGVRVKFVEKQESSDGEEDVEETAIVDDPALAEAFKKGM